MRDEDLRYLVLGPVDGLGKVFGINLVEVGDRSVEDQHPGGLSRVRAMAIRRCCLPGSSVPHSPVPVW